MNGNNEIQLERVGFSALRTLNIEIKNAFHIIFYAP